VRQALALERREAEEARAVGRAAHGRQEELERMAARERALDAIGPVGAEDDDRPLAQAGEETEQSVRAARVDALEVVEEQSDRGGLRPRRRALEGCEQQVDEGRDQGVAPLH